MSLKKSIFEEAIQESLFWCKAWDTSEISDEVLADKISSLIASRDGARGFFAVSLTEEIPLMDRLPEALIFQLRNAGKSIIELTVRNLAMSTAMAVIHQRNNDKEKEAGSNKVKRRCQELLRLLEPNSVKEALEKFLDATKGIGDEVKFLDKWNYDDEQRQAIGSSITAVVEK